MKKKNVGEWVKIMALVWGGLMILGCIVGAIILASNKMAGIGAGVFFGGIFVTASFTLLVYGFGELIHRACLNQEDTRKLLNKSTYANSSFGDDVSQIMKVSKALSGKSAEQPPEQSQEQQED